MDATSRNKALILWLEDARCHEAQVVGGKAASLARLAAKHNVPPGFAIPMVPARPAGPLAAPLRSAIERAYSELGKKCGVEAPGVAVRSSAMDEDSGGASFAGMHDTFLNIAGPDAVLEAIQKSWASAVSPRALAYRRQKGLPVDDVQIAALVQQLVPADVSGVAFSLNPVSRSRDEIVITTSWGLGESLVAGTVTPDTIRVRKSDLAILSHDAGRKRRMTVAATGGVKEVGVPRLLQERPCLEDHQARAIARLVRELEEETGAPVDIECVLAKGELYLLQCRPVTT